MPQASLSIGETTKQKVVITGAAGLVGQNLIQRMVAHGGYDIVAIDKSAANSAILAKINPGVEIVVGDLAVPGAWEKAFAGAAAVVNGHAQIGGIDPDAFVRNNIRATEHVMAAVQRHHVPYLVNISSSVVNSAAVDNYTETKKAQEALVLASGISQAVLRPTLMFGPFDRKHVGWLARFMQRAPIFPIPDRGRYLRQPLFVGDFCAIIESAIARRIEGTYNISGQQEIDYVDMIRQVRAATGAKARIVFIPYKVFWGLLKAYAFIDRDPPFTTKQLEALVTPDLFEVIDWPNIFDVRATPFEEALAETFRLTAYSDLVPEF